MRVEVYWNTHRQCLSARPLPGGRVFHVRDPVTILNARFVVQPAGRRRTIQSGVKCIHAFIRGELVHKQSLGIGNVVYRPTTHTSFMWAGQPVTAADRVSINVDRGRPDVTAINFDHWLKLVADVCQHTAGVSLETLGDPPFRELFNEGDTPEQAARTVLLVDGFPPELLK